MQKKRSILHVVLTILVLTTALGQNVTSLDNSACTLDCQNDSPCVWQWQSSNQGSHLFLKVMACDCADGYGGPLCDLPLNSTEIAQYADDECDLDCLNDGSCTWQWKSTGMHKFEQAPVCICQEGYSGTRCQIKNAPLAVEDCDKQCQNGGQCALEWTSDNTTGLHEFQQEVICKCPNGFTGDLCEIKDSGCSHTCHNGGRCVSSWESSPRFLHGMIEVYGCECAPGFTGPSCELATDDSVAEDDKCVLECQNKGECVFTWMESTRGNYFDTVFLSSFMMCECPKGYMGLLCEYRVETCRDNTLCFNGGICTTDSSNNEKYSCDCAHLEGDDADMCLNMGKSVNRCDYEHSGHEMTLFCVNGGTCQPMETEENTSHHSCDCPDGFSGQHCEYKSDGEATVITSTAREVSAVNNNPPSEIRYDAPNPLKIALGTIFGFAGLVLFALVAFRVVTQDNRISNPAKAATPSYPPCFALDVDGTSLAERRRYMNEAGTSAPVLAHKQDII